MLNLGARLQLFCMITIRSPFFFFFNLVLNELNVYVDIITFMYMIVCTLIKFNGEVRGIEIVKGLKLELATRVSKARMMD